MPCPVSGGSTSGPSPGIERREFLKSALAIGGASALSACVSRGKEVTLPRGPEDLDSLPRRQHAWNDYLVTDPHGNTVLPHHQLLLFLDVTVSNPTATDRERAESALTTLERAFQRGTGGDRSATATDGLFFSIGYAPSYFDRFDADLSDSVDLPAPETVLEATDEDPSKADHHDALLMLTSDHVEALLESELALFGDVEELNGVAVDGGLEHAFEVVERRTGFIGKGLPSERLDHPVPEESPQAMGFKSGFRDNQASEERVTIADGPFAGGTTQHVSKLQFDLGEWYENDHDDRVELMFSPEHTSDEVGEVGDFLASDSKVTDGIIERTDQHARHRGRVGHTQKVARARDDGEPLILRRSEGISTDGEVPGLNFTSVQQRIGDFIETRKAMNGTDLSAETDGEGGPSGNGILDFIEVRNRANFLLPPRPHRALPGPKP